IITTGRAGGYDYRFNCEKSGRKTPSFTGKSMPHRMAYEGSANYGFLLRKGVRQSYDRSGSGPLYHKYGADVAAKPEFPDRALDGESSAIDSDVYSVSG
ncbi:MAG: hypothetical protein MR762_12700, partial [Clostridiales bacterium]|nr:hypothetical protein [Clostridiales bacterium]